MKKIIAISVVVLALLILPFSVFADEEYPVSEIIEEYVNVSSVNCFLSISSSGNTSISIDCSGKAGTTHISSTTYLEKKSGTSWTRVSINGASQIEDGASASYLSKTYNTTVGSGIYRATVTFTVTRNGVDETVTVYSNIVYH